MSKPDRQSKPISSRIIKIPGPLHYRNLQFAKNQALRNTQSYKGVVHLNYQAIKEIHWWRDHLIAWNGRYSEITHPTYNKDRCFDQGLGCPLPGCKNRGRWSPEEKAPYQLFRAPSWIPCSKNICKRSGTDTYPSPYGQCFSSDFIHQHAS